MKGRGDGTFSNEMMYVPKSKEKINEAYPHLGWELPPPAETCYTFVDIATDIGR